MVNVLVLFNNFDIGDELFFSLQSIKLLPFSESPNCRSIVLLKGLKSMLNVDKI